jgi:hypothetical protein
MCAHMCSAGTRRCPVLPLRPHVCTIVQRRARTQSYTPVYTGPPWSVWPGKSSRMVHKARMRDCQERRGGKPLFSWPGCRGSAPPGVWGAEPPPHQMGRSPRRGAGGKAPAGSAGGKAPAGAQGQSPARYPPLPSDPSPPTSVASIRSSHGALPSASDGDPRSTGTLDATRSTSASAARASWRARA